MRLGRLRRRARAINCLDRHECENTGPGSRINITELKSGQSARITEILGSEKPARRLAAIGIVPGTVIVKRSSSSMKGPVVIEKNGRHLAVGHRMAQMIIVEPVERPGEMKGDGE